jgi:hypothetical protein
MAEKRMSLQARRSRYFQDIAAAFFRLRGAPFVLSSRDMVLISDWEAAGIPLGVVEEGIRRAYENSRKSQPARGKLASLAFCDREVRRAFQQHRERRVGRSRAPVARGKKADKAAAAVRDFLETRVAGVDYLRPIYDRALGLLARRKGGEADLEKLDTEAERLILERAVAADRAEVEKQVRADFPGCAPEELARLTAVELLRWVRARHAIPHLSLYYY